MSFEILEHSADEKFHAEGESKEEALKEVVKAFAEIVGGDTHGEYHHSISVEAESLESMFYDFLDELIFLQDSEGIVISHAEELTLEQLENGWRLETTVLTDNITSDMNLLDIKAPTYNEMEIDYRDGKWVLEAVLDV
jgi:SHS2 domain-containing protein